MMFLVVVFRGLVVEILTVLGVTAAMFVDNTLFTCYLFRVLALLAVAGAINLVNLFLFLAPNLLTDLGRVSAVLGRMMPAVVWLLVRF